MAMDDVTTPPPQPVGISLSWRTTSALLQPLVRATMVESWDWKSSASWSACAWMKTVGWLRDVGWSGKEQDGRVRGDEHWISVCKLYEAASERPALRVEKTRSNFFSASSNTKSESYSSKGCQRAQDTSMSIARTEMGYDANMIDGVESFARFGKRCQSSSVTKGMKGCKRRKP